MSLITYGKENMFGSLEMIQRILKDKLTQNKGPIIKIDVHVYLSNPAQHL